MLLFIGYALSWGAFVSVIVYMVSAFQFVANMKKYESEYWNTIGNPGLYDPNEQIVILKLIIFPKKLPTEIWGKYKSSIRLIRRAGLASGLCLLGTFVIIFMRKNGYY